MLSCEQILAALNDHGYRQTRSRRLIVEAVTERGTSFTAPALYDELAEQGVGRATVFRTIRLLQDLGLLNNLHIGDGCHTRTLCEPEHHHHLVCVQCGAVYPLIDCTFVQEFERSAASVGFAVQGHHVEVFGRCADCSAA